MNEKELFFLVYLAGYQRGNPISVILSPGQVETEARKEFDKFWDMACERGLDKVRMTRG